MDQKSEAKQCPKCKQSLAVVRIAYGKPGPQLIQDAKNGKVYLGGCSVDSKTNYCKNCQVKF